MNVHAFLVVRLVPLERERPAAPPRHRLVELTKDPMTLHKGGRFQLQALLLSLIVGAVLLASLHQQLKDKAVQGSQGWDL